VTPDQVTIEVAQPSELGEVVKILDDAAAWLREQGIEQWPDSFSEDATWRMDRIRSYVECGLTYLVRDSSGRAVATFTLSSAADPQFAHGWPDSPDLGGYVFRMAVLRSAAGSDLGSVMLDFAAAEVARWGKPWLRVDVHRHNRKLQAYYERRGFVRVGEVTAPDLSVPGRTRGSGTLMQRPTTEGNLTMTTANYDPDGTAAIWLEASNVVRKLKLSDPPADENAWNTALDQAARVLERHALEIKQANGMYYRALTGRREES
jgi:GNAT superfamily N-acetyltransferase